MTWAPDGSSNTWYTVQPGEYGEIGPFGYGSHPGEYGVDTAHGIVPIVIGQAYATSQFLSRNPPCFAHWPRPARRRSLLRGLARLVLGVALACVVTAAVALLTYPPPHVAPPHHHHPAALLRR